MADVIAGFGTENASAAAVLRVATALTSSYVATDAAPTLGFNCCRFLLGYAKGSETLALVRPEGYDGANWWPLGFKATQASAASDLSKDIISLTPANYAASDSVSTPVFDCRGFQKVRASVEYSGGSAPGTLAVSVVFGSDVVR